MSYLSIDTLQKYLATKIFREKTDAKKAAGRALGTIVEIITYYLLREWGLTTNICIETQLPEYGNPDITHNVEFTLHKVLETKTVQNVNPPYSKAKLYSFIDRKNIIFKNNTLLDSKGIIKNSCILGLDESAIVTSNLIDGIPLISILDNTPVAMFECKRVGVEEGQKKGPQTIEKAKQGAYVAMKASALQKVRDANGKLAGIYFKDGTPLIDEYETLLNSLLESKFSGIIVSFGIISNHGNWFTSNDMNKELKVLAQSYDRLLFLTDAGLASFIEDTILNPANEYIAVRDCFFASYSAEKKSNIFTKSKMALTAHNALCHYFHKNIDVIESWFNIISPSGTSIHYIKEQLRSLTN